jgi:hypothetical protein
MKLSSFSKWILGILFAYVLSTAYCQSAPGTGRVGTATTSDPIDLTIRTNYDSNYVLDCVSQALMWIYFGEAGKSCFHFP